MPIQFMPGALDDVAADIADQLAVTDTGVEPTTAQAVHDLLTAPKPEPDERAAWIADMRAMLDWLEANPGLPYPVGETVVQIDSNRLGRHLSFEQMCAEVDRLAAVMGVEAGDLDGTGHYKAEVQFGGYPCGKYLVVAIPGALDRGVS